MIDWPLHGKALSLVERRYRPSVLKNVWDEHPCKKKMKRDGRKCDGRCPLCHHEDDARHFARCEKMRDTEEYQKARRNLGAKLRRRNLSPVIAMWIMKAFVGEKPGLESEGRRKSDQIVTRAYRKQESVGWENLAKGRAVTGVVAIQEDWKERGEAQLGRKEDARETVARSLAYVMLYRKEIRKARCEEVLKIELPVEKAELYLQIVEFTERRNDVVARDRGLFEDRNVPKPEDDLNRMKQWLRGVKGSIKRREKIDEIQNRRMSEFI